MYVYMYIYSAHFFQFCFRFLQAVSEVDYIFWHFLLRLHYLLFYVYFTPLVHVCLTFLSTRMSGDSNLPRIILFNLENGGRYQSEL
jgi:hypothetical protein